MDAYLKSLLGDNETVLLSTNRHWIVLLENILVELIISAITIAIVTILMVVQNTGGLVATGYLLLIIPLVSLVRDVLVWVNNRFIVTNLRVIQLSGIFNKNVIDSSLEKVNDVKMQQSVIGRLLDFGDVEVLTASEMAINRFTRISRPVRFKTVMLNAKIRLDEHGINLLRTEPDVPALIERLGKLRDQGLVTQAEFEEKKAKLLAKI